MKTILIIEDEKSMIAALRDHLTNEGYRVCEAYNGEEGLSAMTRENPDLVLLDIVMPKMDGITMLERCAADDGPCVPVLVLTNLSDRAYIDAAMKYGARDYLIKTDWSLGDLSGKIREKIG